MEQGLGLSNALTMISALGDNLRMNFSTDEVRTLANLGKDFDLENMRQVPLVDTTAGINLLTTGAIGGVSYVLPTAGVNKYEEIHEYIDKQLNHYNDPSPEETTENTETETTSQSRSTTVTSRR